MKFSVGCDIGYEIIEPATLIFNIEAIAGGRQRILGETLTINSCARPNNTPTSVRPVDN